MFVRSSCISILVYVICHSGLAVAQQPAQSNGMNWPNGTWSTVVGGGIAFLELAIPARFHPQTWNGLEPFDHPIEKFILVALLAPCQ